MSNHKQVLKKKMPRKQHLSGHPVSTKVNSRARGEDPNVHRGESVGLLRRGRGRIAVSQVDKKRLGLPGRKRIMCISFEGMQKWFCIA